MTAAEILWHLYLLRCGDGSLYTGISTDVERRLRQHRGELAGSGAKALRGRQPLTLAFSAPVGDRSRALKLEYRVKQLSRDDKEALLTRAITLESLLTEPEP